MDVARSKNGVLIRLTEERWVHITEEHSEMAGYYYNVLEAIEDPEAVLEGKSGELLAIREIEEGKHIVVVYREVSPQDGFIVTAFSTRRIKQILQRRRLWPR